VADKQTNRLRAPAGDEERAGASAASGVQEEEDDCREGES
jgi:hypothetical protein